ncbi:ABC transporter substrate-binding protein [Niveibacterium sp.]|uniref:ABC transporter substrate-binding protein n=1 Tax=Niveibacterium sp. TaxID=2017444 RepID=UPI0035B1A51E
MDPFAPASLPSLTRRRLVSSGLGGLALAGLGSGCQPEVFSVPTRPLRIAIDLWAGHYPLLLARERGLLKAQGIDVEVVIPENTRQLLSDFAAGSYDGVCVSLGDMITLTRAAPDIHMVLASGESIGADRILGRESPSRVEDVRGARIGTSLGGFGELLVLRFAKRYGLSLGDIELVHVDASEVPAHLARGVIDYGHTWEPYVAQAREQGFVEVFSSRDTPGLVVNGLICHGSVLQRRGAEIRALISAWFEAVDWWNRYELDAEPILRRALGGRTNGVVRVAIRLLTRDDNRAKFRRGPTEESLYRVAEVYADHFIARGLIGRRPTPSELLDSGFLA